MDLLQVPVTYTPIVNLLSGALVDMCGERPKDKATISPACQGVSPLFYF